MYNSCTYGFCQPKEGVVSKTRTLHKYVRIKNVRYVSVLGVLGGKKAF
jgi:hypothetical protein